MFSASLANLLLSHAHAEMHVNHPNKNLVLILTKQWQPWSICTPCEMMSLYSCEPTFSQWCYFWIPRSDQRPQQKKNDNKTNKKHPASAVLKDYVAVVSWSSWGRSPDRHWGLGGAIGPNTKTAVSGLTRPTCSDGFACLRLNLVLYVCLLRYNNSRELGIAARTKGRLCDLYEAFKALWWVRA